MIQIPVNVLFISRLLHPPCPPEYRHERTLENRRPTGYSVGDVRGIVANEVADGRGHPKASAGGTMRRPIHPGSSVDLEVVLVCGVLPE
jgi:hypothetical protein